jgi:HEAT repeat protein
VAFLLAGLAYRFRDALGQAWEAFLALLVRLLHYLGASAEENYREMVGRWARSIIMPAHAASLDAVFVEPALLAPVPSPQSISEVEPVYTGPRVLPLRRMLGGHPQLLILGEPGMGKTAMLAYLARVCALSALGDRSVGASGIPDLVRERLPLYVLISAMDWAEVDQETGQGSEVGQGDRKKGGALERLVGAALSAVGGSSGLARPLRQYLEAGRSIVLADGWDELLPWQRQQAAAWLVELVETLPGNIWLVSAGTRDYALLTDAGFVPLDLAPWDISQVEAFAKQWVEAYTPTEGPSPVSSRELADELRHAVRMGSSPLELALRAFVYLSDRRVPVGRAALFDRVLELLLWQERVQEEEPWLLAACRATLGQVALELQREERVTASRGEIEAVIEAALPPSEERPARAVARAFRVLTGERGVLRAVGSNRYAFAHSLWQAYLAARQLVAVDPSGFVERLEDPRWSDVLRFYAELGDMGPLVAAWLGTPDDIFLTRLRILSSWIGVAPKDAAWRDGTMAVLARAFLRPNCLSPTRRALAEAMTATGVPGIVYFLKQAMQHPDAEVRKSAALGLARVATESDIPAFEAALRDGDPAVREAAVRALAYPGIDAAKRLLSRILVEEDDTLRPVAAEALARCGKESVDFLREAVESEDVMIRRAAVFGLAHVGARGLLEKVAREDDQWVVRTAATAALERLEEQEKGSDVAPMPEIEHLPWLISWAAAQGEGVGLGDAARQMLHRVLSEGDDSARLTAAQLLIRVGRPDDVEPLRARLADPNPAVANTALDALSEIGRRYDLKIEPGGK